MTYLSTILMTEFVTHDVKRFILTRPRNLDYRPGQGVEIVIDDPKWRNEEGRPFTPTSLSDDKVLEFTIKRYPAHKGVTDNCTASKVGAKLLISEPFGTITYKGPGVFIAAGAGVTPFIAITRQLARRGENSIRILLSTPTRHREM